MKIIAFVVNTSWHIYNFRLGLIKALQGEGYRIVAISPHDDFTEKLIENDIEHYDVTINNIGTNPFEDSLLICNYYKLYRSIRPDLLMHFTAKPNIYGSVAAKLLGIPAISSITGLGTIFLHSSIALSVAKLMYRITLRVPKKVFFENHNDRDLFVEKRYVPIEKTVLAPGSGINTALFRPRISKCAPDRKEVKFLLIARLLKDKGLLEYIDAIRLIRAKYGDATAHFSILGSFYPGNPTAITKDIMDGWVDEGVVEYLGSCNTVKRIIDDYDCVVLPSYREGLSRVLLEAASMARPIVTTDVPGCREVVEDGRTGFLCKKKDPFDLAAKMEKIFLLSHRERSEMGIRGREKVIDEFDEKLVIDIYLGEIAKLW